MAETSDDVLIDCLHRDAFDYFLRNVNPQNGLVADTTRDGAPSSIAVIGFALSTYPIGAERGWMGHADAVQRTLAALRFFMSSDQSGKAPRSGGCKRISVWPAHLMRHNAWQRYRTATGAVSDIGFTAGRTRARSR